MFKRQHYFRKNVATEKSIILRKMSFKFQNFKSDFLCTVALYTFFSINWTSLELRGHWGTSISSWIRFYASVFKKTKTIHKSSSRNIYKRHFPQKQYNNYSHQICLSLVVYHHNLWKERHIDGSLVKSISLFWYMSDLIFFFLSGSIIWCFFVFCGDFNSSSFSCSNVFQLF